MRGSCRLEAWQPNHRLRAHSLGDRRSQRATHASGVQCVFTAVLHPDIVGEASWAKDPRRSTRTSRAESGEARRNPTAGSTKLSNKEYEREMYKLQTELVKLQEWVKTTGARIVIIFEGRDAAGKGGTIKRITERVSPRVFRLVALPAPTERQKIADLHATLRRATARRAGRSSSSIAAGTTAPAWST